MRARLLLAAVTATSVLAGCSSQPSMNYQQAPTQPQYQGDMDGLSKFSLAKSTLFVNYADPEKKPELSWSRPLKRPKPMVICRR